MVGIADEAGAREVRRHPTLHTRVRRLPSSPGCFGQSPALRLRSFRLGENMWKKEESKPAAPAAEAPGTTAGPTSAPRVETPGVRSVAGLTAEVVQPSG